MFFIQPTAIDIERALESWQWLHISGKSVIRVSSFGDFFLQDNEGIWFLDTLEGKITRICASEVELNDLLSSEEGQDHYLFGGLVERAFREGRKLDAGQCYDFKLNPVVGGAIAYDNVEVSSFVVAVNIAGQLHDKVRFMKPGTKISGFTIAD